MLSGVRKLIQLTIRIDPNGCQEGPTAIHVAIEIVAKVAKRRDSYVNKLTALGVALTDRARLACHFNCWPNWPNACNSTPMPRLT
jgi:hypothetical protein